MRAVFDLVVRNGRFVTPSGIVEGWLGVQDGKIAALGAGNPPPSQANVDASGNIVLPGGIDPHVHFRDPGFTYKEDFGTGTAAAAAGGVTTIFDMPNTHPAVLSVEILNDKRAMAESKALVDFGLYAAADPTNLDEFQNLTDAGAIAFKVFLSDPAHPPPQAVTDEAMLWQVFDRIARTGRPVCVHAENQSLVQFFTKRALAGDTNDPLIHLNARPTICETEAIQRAILVAADVGAHLHICHLSSGAGAELVRAARARGIHVTAETGPQNLLLNDGDYARLGSRMKMKPPVRTAADSATLWDAVLDGAVDMLATDHAPHTAEEKLKDMPSAASGFVGVETTLPLMLTQVNAGSLTLAQLNRLRSEMPARVFGIYPSKGVIQVGADADLVVIDMDKQWTISSERLHSRSTITPFDGFQAQGAVVQTILRGNVIFADVEIVGMPRGKMVKLIEGNS